MIDTLLHNESIKQKYRTFIDLYYFQGVRSVEKAKEHGISERTYYRRKKEVHYIIQENWQKNNNEHLQNENKKVTKIIFI